MASFNAITALIPTLNGRIGADARVEDVQSAMLSMGDTDVISVVQNVVELGRFLEQIGLIGAGVIGVRSRREAGHSGLAQRLGHRSPVTLLQQLTGVTKGEAARQVRVGEALIGAGDPGPGKGSAGGGDGSSTGADPEGKGDAERDHNAQSGAGPDPDAGSDTGSVPETDPEGQSGSTPVPPQTWHEPLGRALREGRLVGAQFDAIRRGLGEPPEGATAAWTQAAIQLIDEAARRTVEELLAAARTIRDMLDPDGAEARFLARYERRAFRSWLDQDGVHRASIAFDDEGGAWLDAIFASALRPRRGGPRFVDPDEKARGADLAADPRTNDQLAYDLLMDLIRAGTLATPETVFGTRQAGLRLVQTLDHNRAFGRVAHTEDGLTALPGSIAERRLCEAGSVNVTIDSCGNPLDVGREHRLFTPRQRIALAIRDGGCRWTGCDRPASYCEAHHIDPYSQGGRTDIDRGILLCRFHHMQLHHGVWRITRHGTADFMLRNRGGDETVLHRRLALTYAWAGIDPPPERFTPAA